MYIWQNEEWPNFVYDSSLVSDALSRLHKEKEKTDVAYSLIDGQTRNSLIARNVAGDIVSSLGIEGESIDVDSVYSSVAKHFNVSVAGKANDSAYARSIVEVVWDALENHGPLTHRRLFDWNTKLFENMAGIKPKTIGAYRTGPEYVMKHSSMDGEVIYEAVAPERVEDEMCRLLRFVNSNDSVDCFEKAAVASLWFVLIHPFEDGNGRISRAIADYLIAKDSGDSFHAFNLSTGIIKDRSAYYQHIRTVSTDNNDLDITSWIDWFIGLVSDCVSKSREILKSTMRSASFMKGLDPSEYNSREMSILYRLVDGSFYGKLTTEKWMKMTKCSKAAAFRDIQHLVSKGFLYPSGEAGRSQGYYFNQDSLESRL